MALPVLDDRNGLKPGLSFSVVGDGLLLSLSWREFVLRFSSVLPTDAYFIDPIKALDYQFSQFSQVITIPE